MNSLANSGKILQKKLPSLLLYSSDVGRKKTVVVKITIRAAIWHGMCDRKKRGRFSDRLGKSQTIAADRFKLTDLVAKPSFEISDPVEMTKFVCSNCQFFAVWANFDNAAP